MPFGSVLVIASRPPVNLADPLLSNDGAVNLTPCELASELVEEQGPGHRTRTGTKSPEPRTKINTTTATMIATAPSPAISTRREICPRAEGFAPGGTGVSAWRVASGGWAAMAAWASVVGEGSASPRGLARPAAVKRPVRRPAR